jgi:hypothetical protein
MKKFFRKCTILAAWVLFAAAVLFAGLLTLVHLGDTNQDHFQELLGFWLIPVIPGAIALSVRPFLNWFGRWNP